MDFTTILIILIVGVFVFCVILCMILCICEAIRTHRLWKKHDEYFKHGCLKIPKGPKTKTQKRHKRKKK